MVKLNREQAISIAALAGLLLAALTALTLSVQARSDAAEELSQRQDALARLEAGLRARKDTRGRPSAAPPAAFLEAPSEGLASAQFAAYVARLAGEQQAVLISSGVEAAKGKDAADPIRLQVTFDARANELQTILHRLESGTPYAFVRSLTVQPVTTAAQRTPEDPVLRTTLTLGAAWQRSKP